jgi:hypothetical protein
MSWHCVGPGAGPSLAAGHLARSWPAAARAARRCRRRRRAGAAARAARCCRASARGELRGSTCSPIDLDHERAARARRLDLRQVLRRGPCRGGATRSSKMRGELTIAASPGSRAAPGSPRCGTAPSSGPRRRRADAAGQLLAGPHRRRAGDVDVDVLAVVRILEHRVRVRAAARLHVADVRGLRMSLMSKMRMPRSRSGSPPRARPACRSRAGPPAPRPRRRAGCGRPRRRSATPGRRSPVTSTGRAGSRCPRSGSRCSCPGSRSCR